MHNASYSIPRVGISFSNVSELAPNAAAAREGSAKYRLGVRLMRAFARGEGSQALRSSMIDRLRKAPKYAENVGLDISLPCAFTIFDIDDTAICELTQRANCRQYAICIYRYSLRSLAFYRLQLFRLTDSK